MSLDACHSVVVVLGSASDLEMVKLSQLFPILNGVGVTWELSIISAHRNPEDLRQYCEYKLQTGTVVFIAVAGMAAALPGAIASHVSNRAQVFGVALSADILSGMDALLSMVRMPPGVPVCVMGLDSAGLHNAGLAACTAVGLVDSAVSRNLRAYFETHRKAVQLGVQSSNGGNQDG